MDWINQNLQLITTLGSALAVYGFIRAGARKDIDRLEKDFEKLRSEFKEVRSEAKSIDQRLSRIEIRMELMGHTAVKEYISGKEEKK